MAVKPSYCRKCNISKVNRAPHRDKVLKKKGTEIQLEQLGFDCKKCERKWVQIIDYTKTGSARIKWKQA